MLGLRRAGIEIAPHAVRVTVVRRLGTAVRPLAYAEAPLDPDVFVPSWERENVPKEVAFQETVSGVLRAAGATGAHLGVALPDLTARLRILPSERPPTDRGGIRAYALWRLHQESPRSPARVGPAFYLNGNPTRGYMAMLVAAEAAIAQIERLIRAAGAEPIRITNTATAIFDLLTGGLAPREEEIGAGGVLVVGHPSATLLLTSDGAPIFARTFRHTWAHAFSEQSITAICAEVAASLDWCADAGLPPAKRIMLAGEYASSPGLAEALTDHVSIPCHLAGLPWRLRGQNSFPAQGIGALAAALC